MIDSNMAALQATVADQNLTIATTYTALIAIRDALTGNGAQLPAALNLVETAIAMIETRPQRRAG